MLAFKALLQHGADANIRIPSPGGLHETLLGRAIQQRVYTIVRELLAFGADPNVFHLDAPPILLAVRSGALHMPISTLLIAHGADVKKTKLNGETRSSALEYAVRDRRQELVQQLLKHGANPRRHVGKTRMTALHMAARRGVVVVVMLE